MEKVRLNGDIKGVIEGKWYITKRKPEHFMRKYQGFGISKDILLELERRGIEDVRIIYEGKRGIKVFETQVSAFLRSSLVHIDRGKDKQKFLSVRVMVDKYG